MCISFESLLEALTTPGHDRSRLFRALTRKVDDVNQPTDFEKWTLLHWAAHWGLGREAEELIKRGANPFLRTARGEMALELAARMGHHIPAKKILIAMLRRAAQNPYEYQLLKEELADWYFYFRTGWIPDFFIGASRHRMWCRPKTWPHWRIVLMVLSTIEEIFIKIQNEEEKDRLFPHEEKMLRSWDPLWEHRKVIPSPITCILEGQRPLIDEVPNRVINMRDSFWNYLKGMFDVFISIKFDFEVDDTQVISTLRETFRKHIFGERDDFTKLCSSLCRHRDDFTWVGANALYLPGKEETLPEEKYRRIMGRIEKGLSEN